MLDKRISSADSPRTKATLAGAGVLLIFALAGASLIDDDAPERSTATQAEPISAESTTSPSPLLASAEGESPKDIESTSDNTNEAAPKRSRNALRVPRAKSPVSLGRLLTSFAAVLILGALVVFGARTFLKRTRMATQGEKVLRLVDALPLGPKKQIYVVEVEGRRLVVGAGPETITLLSEFNDEEIAERIAFAKDEVPARPAAGMPPMEELVR